LMSGMSFSSSSNLMEFKFDKWENTLFYTYSIYNNLRIPSDKMPPKKRSWFRSQPSKFSICKHLKMPSDKDHDSGLSQVLSTNTKKELSLSRRWSSERWTGREQVKILLLEALRTT
jgi:hypothetical protein